MCLLEQCTDFVCILHAISVVMLDEVVQGFPYPSLGVGANRGVKTAGQQKTFEEWRTAAQAVAFGAITRQAAMKRKHHAPAPVTPVVFSAGGGILEDDDKLLPAPEDRNGRHLIRVEISTVLLKYLYKITMQFFSRRGPAFVLPGL